MICFDALGSVDLCTPRLHKHSFLISRTIWENGVEVETPFDGLMAFSDATELWGLNESTLRKAITYGKPVNGVDVCKFGKQWVVSIEAMRREYGNAVQ